MVVTKVLDKEKAIITLVAKIPPHIVQDLYSERLLSIKPIVGGKNT